MKPFFLAAWLVFAVLVGSVIMGLPKARAQSTSSGWTHLARPCDNPLGIGIAEGGGIAVVCTDGVYTTQDNWKNWSSN